MEGLEFLSKVGVLDPPLVVKLDHLLQRLETPVVHVRGRMGDISEGRGLEGSFVFIPICDVIAAQIGVGIIEAYPCVVKLLIRKVEPLMALRTFGLPFEELEPSLRLYGEGRPVPGLEAVEGGVAGENRPDKGGEGFDNPISSNRCIQDALELFGITSDPIEFLHPLIGAA